MQKFVCVGTHNIGTTHVRIVNGVSSRVYRWAHSVQTLFFEGAVHTIRGTKFDTGSILQICVERLLGSE